MFWNADYRVLKKYMRPFKNFIVMTLVTRSHLKNTTQMSA